MVDSDLRDLVNVSQSPLGLTFEGEEGQVLATMPFGIAPRGVSKLNMPFMGFPSQKISSGSPKGGEGEVSFENKLGFCKTGTGALGILSANVSAPPPKP